jgi:hypothetical protein
VAAADRLAQVRPLDPEAAAGTGRRQQVGLDEERPHQGRPEQDECEDDWAAHLASIGTKSPWDKIPFVSWLYIALLAAAVAVVVAAEWPRLGTRVQDRADARAQRRREKRKASFRVVEDPEADDAEDFAASVERDLASLPTIEDRDRRR